MPTLEVSEETLKKIRDQLGEELEIKEVKDMEDLIGETYLFQCARYLYHGKVKDVNSTFITLEDSGVVFETGAYDSKQPEDLQKLPYDVKVMRQSIESFCKMKW